MSTTTPYAVRWRGPALLPYGRAWDVAVSVEHAGASPTVSAATFTLYTPDGAARLNAEAASEASGVITYTIADSVLTAADLGPRWMIKLEVTIGGVSLPFYNDAAVCLAPLYPPAGTSDLTDRYSKLDDLQGSSGAAALQAHITGAWGELTQKLYADGVPFWKMRSPGALRSWLMARSLELALDDLALLLESDSHYADEARRHGAMLDKAYKEIRARLDVSEDNTLSEAHEGATGVLLLTSGRSGRRYLG
jgi:hypothetical protein